METLPARSQHRARQPARPPPLQRRSGRRTPQRRLPSPKPEDPRSAAASVSSRGRAAPRRRAWNEAEFARVHSIGRTDLAEGRAPRLDFGRTHLVRTDLHRDQRVERDRPRCVREVGLPHLVAAAGHDDGALGIDLDAGAVLVLRVDDERAGDGPDERPGVTAQQLGEDAGDVLRMTRGDGHMMDHGSTYWFDPLTNIVRLPYQCQGNPLRPIVARSSAGCSASRRR